MTTFEEMLFVIKEYGVPKFLEHVDIEAIDDITVRTVCRTAVYSMEELPKLITSRIMDQAEEARKAELAKAKSASEIQFGAAPNPFDSSPDPQSA